MASLYKGTYRSEAQASYRRPKRGATPTQMRSINHPVHGSAFTDGTTAGKTYVRHNERAYRHAKAAEQPRTKQKHAHREHAKAAAESGRPRFEATSESHAAFARKELPKRRKKKFVPYTPPNRVFRSQTTSKADYMQIEATKPVIAHSAPDQIVLDPKTKFEGVSAMRDAYVFTVGDRGASRGSARPSTASASTYRSSRPRTGVSRARDPGFDESNWAYKPSVYPFDTGREDTGMVGKAVRHGRKDNISVDHSQRFMATTASADDFHYMGSGQPPPKGISPEERAKRRAAAEAKARPKSATPGYGTSRERLPLRQFETEGAAAYMRIDDEGPAKNYKPVRKYEKSKDAFLGQTSYDDDFLRMDVRTPPAVKKPQHNMRVDHDVKFIATTANEEEYHFASADPGANKFERRPPTPSAVPRYAPQQGRELPDAYKVTAYPFEGEKGTGETYTRRAPGMQPASDTLHVDHRNKFDAELASRQDYQYMGAGDKEPGAGALGRKPDSRGAFRPQPAVRYVPARVPFEGESESTAAFKFVDKKQIPRKERRSPGRKQKPNLDSKGFPLGPDGKPAVRYKPAQVPFSKDTTSMYNKEFAGMAGEGRRPMATFTDNITLDPNVKFTHKSHQAEAYALNAK